MEGEKKITKNDESNQSLDQAEGRDQFSEHCPAEKPFISHFYFHERTGFSKIAKSGIAEEKKCLGDLVKESSNAVIHFTDRTFSSPTKFFDHPDWIKLVSSFTNEGSGSGIKCLILESLGYMNNTESFITLAEKLRDLLLLQIPHLEEFGFIYSRKGATPQNKLYPLMVKNPQENDIFPALNQVQLPYLKVVHVENYSFSKHPRIVKDLLKHAVNLERINCLSGFRHLSPEDYELVCKIGKIHCLCEAEMDYLDITNKYFCIISKQQNKQNPLQSNIISFKNLNLCLSFIFGISSITRVDAEKFISCLFESSKNTLSILCIPPLGCLKGLLLPIFDNLEVLSVEQFLFPDHVFQAIFPVGVRSLNLFPAVHVLDLNVKNWQAAFPQEDSIPILPSVKNLKVMDNELAGNSILKLALMCPNLKNFKILKELNKSPTLNFPDVGRSIWTKMKQLESLMIDINLKLVVNNSTALDSCFTGISIAETFKLGELAEGIQNLEQGPGDPIKESKLKVKREFSSILHMKSLKKLIINPYSERKLLDRKCFFAEKLTWISQDYAFKLLPDLELGTEDSTDIF